ncbi:MAG: hypothetical protein M3468_06490 [Acidobacteriota bacterium]|nr:hypothetical protein [Acidobacteriota bacterium]
MTPDDFADLIVTTIKKALEGPLVAGRFDALENKMVAPSLKFQGIYADTGSYEPGSCVTRQGGLWICTTKTTDAFDHECWQLAVRKGDAR